MTIEQATKSPKQSRRVMRLQITPEAFVGMCIPGKPFTIRVTKNGLPEDACSVGVTHDFASNSFFVFVESGAFEEVPFGAVPPLLDVVQFERVGEE